MKEHIHIINFYLPEDLSKEIISITNLISEKCSNDYDFAIRSGRVAVSLYYSPMPSENTEKIKAVIEDVVNGLNPFDLVINDFTVHHRYVFLEFDNKSKLQLTKLREHLVNALIPYRGSTIKESYLDQWDVYTAEEKQRICDTGQPYEYNPHITVARLPIEQVHQALEVVPTGQFRGKTIVCDKVSLLVENESPDGLWPVVGEYELGRMQ